MPSEYRLTGKLEAGELAELYRAERVGVGPVVVKLFHPRTTNVLYAREIGELQKRLVKLSSPSIVQVLDIGLIKGRLAIVREDKGRFTLGQALQRLNTKEIVITPTLTMAIIIDLLEAITEAHGAHVLHGAMTPGNVLLSSSGRAAVCDFGALAALSAVPQLKKSFAGRGRSSYRAPELARGEPVSVQADVYSLGAVLYELLTLKEPSTGSMVSTRREQLPPPSRLDRRLNSRIDPLVLRALDPAPSRRYKTTTEFASALRKLMTETGGLPDREQLGRFTSQLFPNDVQIVEGAVPFEGPFTLTEVEGIELDDFEGSMQVGERKSFSGTLGEMPTIPLDEHPTVTAMPAIEVATAPVRSTNWHAPAAAMPETARSSGKEGMHPDVLKRVKHIEDFAMLGDTDPRVETVSSVELPKVLPGRPEPSPTPVDSQPMTAESVLGDSDAGRGRQLTQGRNVARVEAAAKKWTPIVAACGLLAVGFLVLGMWRASTSADDAPMSTAPPRPPPQPSRHAPDKRTETARDAPPRPPPTKNCYTPPKKALSMGFIGVASDRQIWVKVDGEYVCGPHNNIPVVTGLRSVAFVDVRTGEESVVPVHVEPNRVSPVVPTFKGR